MSGSFKGQRRCPVGTCMASVPNAMLMCAKHWRRVTRATAFSVYREYKKAPQSEAHLDICKKAIEEATKK